MMIQNADRKGEQIQLFCMDDMASQDYLLRIVDRAIDWSFIYKPVEDKYSQDNERPNMDLVMLIKIPFIQYPYGIKSIRQTVKEIEVDTTYRWFLGLDMLDKVPHFSTFGKDYTRHSKDTDLFERIFAHVLSECYKFRLVDPNEILVDATHVEIRTNNKKMQKRITHNKALFFEDLLKQGIDEDREAHGKRPLREKKDDNSTPPGGASGEEEETVRANTSNPESGWFRKGEHKHVFAYTVQTACDKNGWVLSYSIHPGNNHDSRTFRSLYDRIKGIGIGTLIADAGYEAPSVAKLLIDQGVKPLLLYKRPLTKEGSFKKYKYIYNKYYDCYICPNNQVPTYRTAGREGYREYKSYRSACAGCAYLARCTQSKDHVKTAMCHIWEPYMGMCEGIRQALSMKELYPQRRETVERIFGSAKENHGFQYTQIFGKVRMEMKVRLTFACMNLKKLARMKAKWGAAHFTDFILNAI